MFKALGAILMKPLIWVIETYIYIKKCVYFVNLQADQREEMGWG